MKEIKLSKTISLALSNAKLKANSFHLKKIPLSLIVNELFQLYLNDDEVITSTNGFSEGLSKEYLKGKNLKVACEKLQDNISDQKLLSYGSRLKQLFNDDTNIELEEVAERSFKSAWEIAKEGPVWELILLTSIYVNSDVLREILDTINITSEDIANFIKSKMDKLNNNMEKGPGKTQTQTKSSWDSPLRSEPGDRQGDFQYEGGGTTSNKKKWNSKSSTPVLDEFAYNMTDAAKEGKYDPIIGREIEVSQIIEILCCRKKNNAMILGESGCGKTATIELLCQKIVNRDVPVLLLDKKIFSLNLNSIVSGTKFRGEFEKKFEDIIKEVRNNKDVIVFIDEIHNLIGSGSSTDSGDGANILKPYLSRGQFQCIGSTTSEEYRKIIEKSPGMKRRFQNVTIEEASVEDTMTILKTLSSQYSKFHSVEYTDEVLEKCVIWADRYITDKFFPDKAIDVMDMVGSFVKLKKTVDTSNVNLLDEKLRKLVSEKQDATLIQDFESLELLKKESDKLKKQREKEFNRINSTLEYTTVLVEDVAKIISKISNVPIDKIASSDQSKLRDLRNTLETKVIGQDEAIQKVSIAMQRNFLGLRDETKPIACIFMAGPTGTGKTLICKELAKGYFGSEKSLIKFDMAEFSEGHEITKLTGASASYVGYEDAPMLERVRRSPYSVVLFDEIEKANPKIYDIFMSILDEGYILLGDGTKVDFRNTIIVFTGNVGTKELTLKGSGIGFSKSESEIKANVNSTVLKAIEKQFKPEFINRLSDIVVFNSLSKKDLIRIFDLEMSKLIKRTSDKYKFKISQTAKEKIVDMCDTKYGARDLQRNIIKHIENKLCIALLDSHFVISNLSKIVVNVDTNDSGEIIISLSDNFEINSKKENIQYETI